MILCALQRVCGGRRDWRRHKTGDARGNASERDHEEQGKGNARKQATLEPTAVRGDRKARTACFLMKRSMRARYWNSRERLQAHQLGRLRGTT